MSFNCRNCSDPGYQPFSKAKAIEFWIKQDDILKIGQARCHLDVRHVGSYLHSFSISQSLTPSPSLQVPNLKVFLLREEEPKQYCGHEPKLQGGGGGEVEAAVEQRSGAQWFKFKLPMALFR